MSWHPFRAGAWLMHFETQWCSKNNIWWVDQTDNKCNKGTMRSMKMYTVYVFIEPTSIQMCQKCAWFHLCYKSSLIYLCFVFTLPLSYYNSPLLLEYANWDDPGTWIQYSLNSLTSCISVTPPAVLSLWKIIWLWPQGPYFGHLCLNWGIYSLYSPFGLVVNCSLFLSTSFNRHQHYLLNFSKTRWQHQHLVSPAILRIIDMVGYWGGTL